ncbi:MAG: hypothetical protein ABJA94_00280 [Rhodoglobus sp.]
MVLRHLLATAAITGALVVAGVTGAANAQLIPLPVPPGSIDYPIYNQPGLPGFHLPRNVLILKPGPVLKPGLPDSLRPYTVFPTSCTQLFATGGPQGGASLLADTTVQATTEPTLVAQLNTLHSLNCNWANPTSGLQLEVSIAQIDLSQITPLNQYYGTHGYTTGGGGGIVWFRQVSGSSVAEYAYLSVLNYWIVVSQNDRGGNQYADGISVALAHLNGR